MGINSVGSSSISNYYDQLYANQTSSTSTNSSFNIADVLKELSTEKSSSEKNSTNSNKISLNTNGMNAMNRMQGPPPPPPSGGTQKAVSEMTDDEITDIQANMVEMYNSLKESGEDVSNLTDVSGKSVDEMKELLTKMKEENDSKMSAMQGPPPPPPTSETSSQTSISSLSDEDINKIKDSMTTLYNTLKDSGKDVSSLTDVSSKTSDEMKELLAQMQQQRMQMISKYNQNLPFSETGSNTIKESA